MKLQRFLAAALLVIPLSAIAQQPQGEPSTVFVVTGQAMTGLYHRQGCPSLTGGAIVALPPKDAKSRYFQPHCRCMFGEEVDVACKAVPVEAATPAPAAAAVAATPATPDKSPEARAASLVGLSQTQVRSLIGAPSLTQGDTWIYDTPNGTLHVVFKNATVSEARPGDFGLGLLKARQAGIASPSSGTRAVDRLQKPVAADAPPAGATARCKDGTYSFSANRRGTCSGHGGVAVWLK